jgi:hypothetical protein
MTEKSGLGPVGNPHSVCERVSEGRDGLIAAVGGWGERPPDHESHGLRNGCTDQSATRGCPSQEMVEHASEAEHIAEYVRSAPGKPFRTRVPVVRSTADTSSRLRVPIEFETDELDGWAVAL